MPLALAPVGNQTYVVGENVSLLLPAATESVGDVTYTLSPALMGGLAFNPTTRRITGRIAQALADVEFTYTASDSGNRLVDSAGDTLVDSTGDTLTDAKGSVSVTFFLGAAAAEIVVSTVRFSGGIQTQRYQVGVMVAVTLPEAESAAEIRGYELSPDLEGGLSFDPETRQITGTPDAIVNGLRYRYTATTIQGAQVSLEFLVYVSANPYVIDNQTFQSLLPPNATDWEKRVEQVLGESFLPIDDNGHRRLPLIDAWNPNLTGADLLPYLGQNLSVLIDGLLSESQQRELIKQSYFIHTIEGTVGSLLRVIEALGYAGAAIREGVNDEGGNPHWANYSIHINENVPIAIGRALLALVRDTQPVRCRLIAIDVTNANQLWDGSIDFDGTHSFGSIVDAGLMV